MKNFIVSDLHGNGYVYDSILNYLQNELEYGNDDLTLHINGDLIDRGLDSGSMLVDIYERIINHIGININYLGGNHELMMYNSYKTTKDLELNKMFSQYLSQASQRWIDRNMGYTTANYLKKNYTKEEIINLCEFVGNLNIYHKFVEMINDKPILLVHAACVYSILEDKKLKIRDDTPTVECAVCLRKSDFLTKGRVGSDKYFTIIGHTIVEAMRGFDYDQEDNVLYIDGGAASFGYLNTMYLYRKKKSYEDIFNTRISFNEYDSDIIEKLNLVSHVPLVEIKDNMLRILIFNHLNEIITGYYFEDGKIFKINDDELDKDRKKLSKNGKVKKRIRK